METLWYNPRPHFHKLCLLRILAEAVFKKGQRKFWNFKQFLTICSKHFRTITLSEKNIWRLCLSSVIFSVHLFWMQIGLSCGQKNLSHPIICNWSNFLKPSSSSPLAVKNISRIPFCSSRNEVEHWSEQDQQPSMVIQNINVLKGKIVISYTKYEVKGWLQNVKLKKIQDGIVSFGCSLGEIFTFIGRT